MGWTKKEFIGMAFEELGLASYVFDMPAERFQSSLRKLDSMIATWNANGIRLGWAIDDAHDGDINAVVCPPDIAREAIYLNLALRIAPSFGKAPSQETKIFAREAYDNLLNLAGYPLQERQHSSMLPRGSGTKYWRNSANVFALSKPSDAIEVGSDNNLILE